jgi:hypothetical protein
MDIDDEAAVVPFRRSARLQNRAAQATANLTVDQDDATPEQVRVAAKRTSEDVEEFDIKQIRTVCMTVVAALAKDTLARPRHRPWRQGCRRKGRRKGSQRNHRKCNHRKHRKRRKRHRRRRHHQSRPFPLLKESQQLRQVIHHTVAGVSKLACRTSLYLRCLYSEQIEAGEEPKVLGANAMAALARAIREGEFLDGSTTDVLERFKMSSGEKNELCSVSLGLIHQSFALWCRDYVAALKRFYAGQMPRMRVKAAKAQASVTAAASDDDGDDDDDGDEDDEQPQIELSSVATLMKEAYELRKSLPPGAKTFEWAPQVRIGMSFVSFDARCLMKMYAGVFNIREADVPTTEDIMEELMDVRKLKALRGHWDLRTFFKSDGHSMHIQFSRTITVRRRAHPAGSAKLSRFGLDVKVVGQKARRGKRTTASLSITTNWQQPKFVTLLIGNLLY